MKTNTFNTILADASLKSVGLALGIKGDSSAIATKLGNLHKGGTDFIATTDKGFQLPKKELGFFSDKIYQGNPLAFYAERLRFEPLGNGAVEIFTNVYGTGWKAKDKIGAGDFSPVEFKSEIHKWNAPDVIQEAMTKYDLNRGATLVLAERAAIYSEEYLQEAIKLGFKTMMNGALEAKTIAGADLAKVHTIITPSLVSSTDIVNDATKLQNQIVSAATKYIANVRSKGIGFTGYSRSDILITLTPEVMDNLVLAGKVGNYTEQVFSGGRFIMGTIGGYRVQSGEFFLPLEAQASGTQGVAGTKLFGIISTNDTMLFNIDMVAMNVERLAPSNDIGSYVEAAKFVAVTNRAKENEMIHLLVEKKLS